MSVELNGTGESHARGLIKAGKIDKTSAWSMSAEDENAILGTDNWAAYASWHLGVDRAAVDKTKARYKYPFGKGGKVYRSALNAIRQRAGQQGATAVLKAAGALLELVDGKAKFADLECEYRDARFEYRFVETDSPSTKGQFEGYGSVFNNEDSYGDMILPGSFTRTLAEHDAAGTMPKMLLNHGGMGGFLSSPAPEDLLPIGKWQSMCEDTHGLQCKGRLINLDTESGRRIYGAMKEKTLDGLSIGFKAQDFVRGTRANEPARTIKQVRLLEVSPVTFPANASAQISSVKSAIDFTDLKDAERLLREAAGFSRSDATAFIARVTRFGRSESAPDDEMKQFMAAVDRRASLFRP